MMSVSEQDYLLAIYRLQDELGLVSTGGLSAQLGLAPASVTGMLTKLHRQGLVEHQRYRGASLTPTGQAEAVRLLRRHRLWELFLTEYLGLPWDEVHAEAHRLEHATSDQVADRLAHFLREPVADPHGQGIPDRDGVLPHHPRRPLVEVEPGRTVRILEVPDADPALLRRLAAIGLQPGTQVTVGRPLSPGQDLAVRVGDAEHHLESTAARRIYVSDPAPAAVAHSDVARED